jgi:trimeric autotransporter adhesin
MHVWTFSAAGGDRIVIRAGEIAQTNTLNVRLTLLNPDGVQVALDSDALSAEIAVTATNTGIFTLNVDDVGADATGIYRLTLAKSPGAIFVAEGDEGGALTNGYLHTGSLPIGDLDVWSFEANSGDRIVVRMGTGGVTSFEPSVRLYGPNGVLLDSTAGGNQVFSAEVSATATNSGSFTVVVGEAQGTTSGDYRLTLAKSPGEIFVAPGDEGGALTNGYLHTGSLPIGDLDVWSFEANSGDRIVLRMGTGGVTSFEPWVRLYGPDGVLLDSTAGGNQVFSAEVTATATNSGSFTVVVGETQGTTAGDYRLTLAKSPGAIFVAPGDEGGALTNGSLHTGSLPIGDLDVWSFEANSGDRIVVRMGTGGVTSFEPYVRLYGPNGVLLDSTAGGNQIFSAEVTATATNSGSFTVVVGEAQGTTAGDYRLTLAKSPGEIFVATGDEGGPLTNGYLHTGTLAIGDLDVWSFEASSGDRIVVRMGTGGVTSFEPWVRLYGPDGVLLASTFGGAQVFSAEVSATATNSGSFTVVVGETQGTTAGDYRLTLAKSPGAIFVATGDEGGALTNGYLHTGSLPIGDLDVWSFEANSGDRIVVRMGTGGVTSFEPWVRLYGPDGVVLASTAGSSQIFSAEVTATATNSGSFTVVVGEVQGTTAGEYRLTLVKSPGAIFVAEGDEGGALTNGAVYSGSIGIGELDVWQFTACAGDAFVLHIAELTGGTSFTPVMRLYAPNGVLTNTASGATGAQISRTAPMTGTYTLLVGDNGAGAGTYQLTGTGVSTGFILCRPVISGANVIIRSAGGPATSNYVLFATTNVALPFSEWTPIHTNQFSVYGEFSVTNIFSLTTPQEYFRVRTPQ